LGGAESNLWDLCRTYAGLSSTLNYFLMSGQYRTNEFAELNLMIISKLIFMETQAKEHLVQVQFGS
jgi:penicillin-binding protein 1C